MSILLGSFQKVKNLRQNIRSRFRTLTKTKGTFPNDGSLLKLLYIGIQNAQKKWTLPIRNRSLTISQLAIHFDGRLDDALELQYRILNAIQVPDHL